MPGVAIWRDAVMLGHDIGHQPASAGICMAHCCGCDRQPGRLPRLFGGMLGLMVFVLTS